MNLGHLRAPHGISLEIVSLVGQGFTILTTPLGLFHSHDIAIYGDSEKQVHEKIQSQLNEFVEISRKQNPTINYVWLAHRLEPVVIPMGDRYVSIIALVSAKVEERVE